MEEFIDFMKNIPFSFLFLVPVTIILSSVGPTPALGSQEFSVFRLQHFDLNGSPYGKLYFRRCLVLIVLS